MRRVMIIILISLCLCKTSNLLAGNKEGSAAKTSKPKIESGGKDIKGVREMVSKPGAWVAVKCKKPYDQICIKDVAYGIYDNPSNEVCIPSTPFMPQVSLDPLKHYIGIPSFGGVVNYYEVHSVNYISCTEEDGLQIDINYIDPIPVP